MSSRFVKGAMILSISMFLTRFLSLIYIIPFSSIVGPAGLALYGYAYVPYSMFVTLSTLGIPIGVAKFVAKYNADEEYDTSRKIFRLGMFFMICFGLIAFLIMWFGAPFFGNMALGGNEEDLYNSLEDVIIAIRMVSFAVIVVPPIALIRGFFQGNQDMAPTAVSQFVEQLVRILLIIFGAFFVVNVFGGTTQLAVTVAVFAAFIAGLSALFILGLYWRKNVKKFNVLLANSVVHPKRESKTIFKELLSYALPFAILSLVTTLFQVIDTLTFNSRMISAGVNPELTRSIFGLYITPLSKIIMIPVTFAIAFGQPLVPAITESKQKGDLDGVKRSIRTAILLTSFVTLPAVVGMWILSNPLYLTLFKNGPHIQFAAELNVIGGQMFGFGAFIGIFMALNAIMCAIMQGIGLQNKAVVYLLISSVIKLAGNFVLIPIMEFNGAILSTILAYGFSVVLNYLAIKKETSVATRKLAKQHVSIFLFSAIMGVAVYVSTLFLGHFFDYTQGRGVASLFLLVGAFVGVVVYGALSYYFGLFDLLLGQRFTSRFKRRKS